MPPRNKTTKFERRDRPHDGADPIDTVKLFDRPPPNSPEAEKGVLASMLLDYRVIDDVVLVLKSEHFYSPSYRTVFDAIMLLHNGRAAVELNALVDKLTAMGGLHAIGGMPMLLDIMESAPIASNATWYATTVRDRAVQRNLLYASVENIRDVFDVGGEEDNAIKSLVERAESRVMQVSEDRVGDQVGDLSGTLNDLMNMIDTAGSKPRGLPTGYIDLDAQVRVLPGHLIIVAARPSLGKSALCTSLCENLCLGQGKRGLLFTLEMSRLEVAERMLASLSGVPMHRLTSGSLTGWERTNVIKASAEMSQMLLCIDDTASRTMTDIAAVCRRMKRDRKGGLDFVMIDYLQLIEAENVGARETRETQVAQISKRLKRLARELDVPVFCLAQCNRQVADAKDQRPKLHHLRESGSVEQDADQVWFVHREEYYAATDFDKKKVEGDAELIIAKQRNGWTGTIHLTFIKERCRFENKSHVPD